MQQSGERRDVEADCGWPLFTHKLICIIPMFAKRLTGFRGIDNDSSHRF
jgi:hypothetical protein